jgi:hypothetical protein
LDHVGQAVPDVVRRCLVKATQGPVDEEHGQAVHWRPGQELGAWTTLAGQDAGLDEFVQRGRQKSRGHRWQDQPDSGSAGLHFAALLWLS